MSSKRNRLEIIHDILDAVKEEDEIKPTHILYNANLSHDMMEKYLEDLLEKDMLEEKEKDGGKRYSLKEKGEEYLREYQKIIDFVETFGLD